MTQRARLERRPNEPLGKWAERLLIHVINDAKAAKAEPASRDEDHAGVDMWITPGDTDTTIPFSITFKDDPKLNKVERQKALELGIALFEAAQYDLAIEEVREAVFAEDRSRRREQQIKVILALDGSVRYWAGRLRRKNRSFITRDELNDLISKRGSRRRSPRKT